MQDEKMRSLEILDGEAIENLEKIVEKNYGAHFDAKQFFVMKTPEDKIWISSRKVAGIDFQRIGVNSIGLYFGKIKRSDKINLSTEGCQLVGGRARKNVALVDKESAGKFLRGEDVVPLEKINCEEHNFVMVRCGEDFLGSAAPGVGRSSA